MNEKEVKLIDGYCLIHPEIDTDLTIPNLEIGSMIFLKTGKHLKVIGKAWNMHDDVIYLFTEEIK